MAMKYAYADQNFLSKCADDATWKAEVVRAARDGRVRLVLSPIHFYEFGNVDTDERRERMLALVEEVDPAWAMERFDMHV